MTAEIPTGFTNKASINRKDQIAQASSMLSTGQAFLDTTGIATSQERRNVAKSVRQQLRRLVSKDNTKLLLWSHAGFIFQALLAAPPANQGAFITIVQTALASAADVDELAPDAAAPSISFKKVLNALSVVNGADGTLMLDMLGGDFTSNLFRPAIPRSLKQITRLLVLKDAITSKMYFSNTLGTILKLIREGVPANIGALNLYFSAPFTASTSSTVIADPAPKAKTTSLLNQLQQVLVTTSDGSIAINDTGDSLSQPRLKLSQQMELKRLLESNGEATPTFRLQFTSGIKLAKVAALNSGTASFADLRSALSDNA